VLVLLLAMASGQNAAKATRPQEPEPEPERVLFFSSWLDSDGLDNYERCSIALLQNDTPLRFLATMPRNGALTFRIALEQHIAGTEVYEEQRTLPPLPCNQEGARTPTRGFIIRRGAALWPPRGDDAGRQTEVVTVTPAGGGQVVRDSIFLSFRVPSFTAGGQPRGIRIELNLLTPGAYGVRPLPPV
jgi:hypothetical protein